MAGILQRYRELYQLADDYPIVTLNEGNTPLIPCENLSRHIAETTGVKNLSVFVKYDGANPTGSFKDRGMTYAVSQAKADGAKHIVCASTGNTSAAAAAYGAKCGMDVLVLIPQGKVALGKLSQAMMYGATIVEIEGNFDEALTIVRSLGETGKVTVVNSINPYRILGQQSAAFEIVDELAQAPDYHFIPVGNAGNITAYWAGYNRYHQLGKANKRPKMMGYEAEGSAAIVRGEVIPHPETFATAIRIGNPASWQQAEAARDESSGTIDYVTEDEIALAYTFLARHEGVFCEPASAASVAGLLKACANGQVGEGSLITCTLTGNGLKDPDSAIRLSTEQQTAKHYQLPANEQAIVTALNL